LSLLIRSAHDPQYIAITAEHWRLQQVALLLAKWEYNHWREPQHFFQHLPSQRMVLVRKVSRQIESRGPPSRTSTSFPSFVSPVLKPNLLGLFNIGKSFLLASRILALLLGEGFLGEPSVVSALVSMHEIRNDRRSHALSRSSLIRKDRFGLVRGAP
jgi:hypothetical protein